MCASVYARGPQPLCVTEWFRPAAVANRPFPPPVHPYSQQPHRPAPHPAHVRTTSAPVGRAGAGFRRGADGIMGDHGAGTAKHIVFSVRARGWIGGGAAAAAPEPASSRCQIVRVHACLRVRACACPSSPGTRSAWPCCSTAPSPCPSGKTFWCVCVRARARAHARVRGWVQRLCVTALLTTSVQEQHPRPHHKNVVCIRNPQ